MLRYGSLPAFVLCVLATFPTWASSATTTIVQPQDASFAERLACKEIRRYVYQRTGQFLPVFRATANGRLPNAAAGSLIVVGSKDRPEIAAILGNDPIKQRLASLPPDGYAIETIEIADRPVLLIVGGDGQGTLYGVYRLAEHLGIRFHLHGDVVPDHRIAWKLPTLHETRKPLFERRGILPFHDFPEGPDWWSRQGYKAVLGQLPKMGMNFFGLHTYPEHPSWWHVGPEPLVWIGLPGDIGEGGKVKASYPSRHFTASNVNGAWGYQPGKTSDYVFGAAELFDRDDFGADYMEGTFPWNKMSPDASNALFNRMGEFLRDTFTWAKQHGIKTCIGTETPLLLPTALKQRLQEQGKNPADPAVVRSLYEGMFLRIAKTHPLDYFWIWTPENWTWDAVKQPQIDAALADMRMALAAADRVKPPFELATCGWVLGPPQSPALLDGFLPKHVAMSCINRQVGFTPVEPGFARVSGRSKWAIPWLEDDPGLAMTQLWVGRVRRDAADAYKYGCNGLMGIHWRTRILAPNAAALATAAWDQSHWTGKTTAATVYSPNNGVHKEADCKSPYAPVDDLYLDWCSSEFGNDVGQSIASLFTRLDGVVPRPSDWITGPGSLAPDKRDWQQVEPEYAFIEELTALRPRVQGVGDLERFDYWLNTFCQLRSMAKVRCAWGRFNETIAQAKAEKDPQKKKQLACDLGLPTRRSLLKAFQELQQYLLATVSTRGEMGTVCNWQQQTLKAVLTDPGNELAALIGKPLPSDTMPSKQYQGRPRLFASEVRTSIAAGEPFELKVVVLASQPAEEVTFYWRPLGTGTFVKMPMKHVARGVYAVALLPEVFKNDFEYYVQATADGKSLVFPATAPGVNHTVIVEE